MYMIMVVHNINKSSQLGYERREEPVQERYDSFGEGRLSTKVPTWILINYISRSRNDNSAVLRVRWETFIALGDLLAWRGVIRPNNRNKRLPRQRLWVIATWLAFFLSLWLNLVMKIEQHSSVR